MLIKIFLWISTKWPCAQCLSLRLVNDARFKFLMIDHALDSTRELWTINVQGSFRFCLCQMYTPFSFWYQHIFLFDAKIGQILDWMESSIFFVSPLTGLKQICIEVLHHNLKTNKQKRPPEKNATYLFWLVHWSTFLLAKFLVLLVEMWSLISIFVSWHLLHFFDLACGTACFISAMIEMKRFVNFLVLIKPEKKFSRHMDRCSFCKRVSVSVKIL